MSLESISAVKSIGRSSEYEGGQSLGQHLGANSSQSESEAFTRYWDRMALEGREQQDALEEEANGARSQRKSRSGLDTFEPGKSQQSFVSGALGFANRGFGNGGLSVVPQFGRLEQSHAKDFGVVEKSETPVDESQHSTEWRETGSHDGEELVPVKSELEVEDDIDDEDTSEKRGKAVIAPTIPLTTNRSNQITDRASAAQVPIVTPAVDVAADKSRSKVDSSTANSSTNNSAPVVMTPAAKAVQAQHGISPQSQVSHADAAGVGTPVSKSNAQSKQAELAGTATVKTQEGAPVSAAGDKSLKSEKGISEGSVVKTVESSNVRPVAGNKPIEGTQPIVRTKPEEGAVVKAEPVNTKANAGELTQSVDVGNSKVDATNVAKTTPELKSPVVPAQSTISKGEGQVVRASDGGIEENRVGGDGKKLTDVVEAGAKEKQSVSSTNRVTRARPPAGGNQAPAAQGNGSEATVSNAKSSETVMTSSAESLQAAKDATKNLSPMGQNREGSEGVGQRPQSRAAASSTEATTRNVASASQGVDKAVAESTVTESLSGRAMAAAASTSTRATNRRSAAPTSQQSQTVAVNGVSAQATNGHALSSGNTSQQQSGEGSSKQDASSYAMKAMSAGKGVEKATGESNQSFSVEVGESTSTRRSQAAAKVQGTSYASKSAEEVKEVYKALSSGIEKMVNLKQETINVRINFDQGGSMALKLKMENGQVKTFMQTDLNGLEAVIKSNWSDLANDWSQRGLKLNTPQFTQPEGGQDGEFSQSFDSRQNAGAESSSQRGGYGGRSSGGNVNHSSSGAGASLETASEVAVDSHQGANDSDDSELKTYA